MKTFTAGENDEGVRLSRFVLRVTQGLPGSLLYKGFRKKRIKVNGRAAAPDTRLADGDQIELYLNDEFFLENAAPRALPEGLPAPSAVFEDENIAVLYKEAGLLSHCDEHGQPGLLEAYCAALAARGEWDPAAENGFAPALCNRLDRNTEGLVLVAKKHAALRGMNELLRLGLVEKTYLCITEGAPPEGSFHAFLRRGLQAHKVELSKEAVPGAKAIETTVRVRAQKGGFCLCEVGLPTGRTHQIRAHLAYLGAPLLGDTKYGTAQGNGEQLGQALCAWRLRMAESLPPENPLAYLSGRVFTVENPEVLRRWAALN